MEEEFKTDNFIPLTVEPTNHISRITHDTIIKRKINCNL